MDMGSATCENNVTLSQDVKTEMGRHTTLKKNYIHRPKFFPCEKCQKKFTIRALVVHKKTCTEREDCCCNRCLKPLPFSDQKQSSGNTLVQNNDVNENPVSRPDTGVSVHSQPLSSSYEDTMSDTNVQNGHHVENAPETSVTLIESCGLQHHTSNIEPAHLGAPEYFVIEKGNERCLSTNTSGSPGLLLLHNAARILAITGMKLEPAVTNGDASDNSNTSLKPNGPIITGNTTGCPERQLHCCVCNGYLPWEIYGSHVIQHAEVSEDELSCPKCMKKFTRSAMLLIHFNKHITDCPFVCKNCMSPFRLCDELKSHTLNIHGYVETQPFHCYICMRRFSHPQTIINHMRLHSKETPFKCKECSRSFSQIGNLQRHLSVHRGDRPHKCSECNKSFADPATLRNHIRIHTGETPFVCKVCMRGFTQIGNLKRHMARHLQNKAKSILPPPNNVSTEPRLFASDDVENHVSDTLSLTESKNSLSIGEVVIAEEANQNMVTENIENNVSIQNQICNEDMEIRPLSNSDSMDSSDSAVIDESAIALSQLKEQRKRNKWQLFPCPVCGKVYTWQHDLSIHFRIHTGEKPYKCDLCDKRFAQSGAVRIHKSRHHYASSR